MNKKCNDCGKKYENYPFDIDSLCPDCANLRAAKAYPCRGCKELQSKNTRLKAQLGRLKEVIEKYKSECQPHPCPDLVLRSIYRELMFKEALSDTDGEAWIKMREDLAMAEAFEKAGRRMKANGCYGSATYCFDRAKEHRKAALRSKGGDRIT